LTDFERKLISLLEKKHSLIGDDCAVFSNYVITTDSLVENVHFSLKLSSPYQVGVKTVCANLSDIASMGAVPKYFLVSLSLPENLTYFADGFLEGIETMLDRFSVKLIGGDTTGAMDYVFVNGVAIGETEKPVLRSGAKPGDFIYLAGIPGYSAIGFYILNNGIEIEDPNYAFAVKKHLEPEPQVEEGITIGKNSLASAMIDISDGLSKELNEICKKSKVGAVIYSEKFQLPEIDLFERDELIKYFLHSGEEYILLFTSSKKESEIKKYLPNAFSIGEITENDGVFLKHGTSLVKLGELTYNHFDKNKGLY